MLRGPGWACNIVNVRSHIYWSKCLFALDTCCRIDIIGPNIEVRCTVGQPSIVALLRYNELHNPIGQNKWPWVWRRVRFTSKWGALVRVRVGIGAFVYVTKLLLLTLCLSIRFQQFARFDRVEAHCSTAAEDGHYVGVTLMGTDTNPEHWCMDLYVTRKMSQ